MPLPDLEKGITGFCPCCGEPRVHGVLIHDFECIWYPENPDKDDKKIVDVNLERHYK